MINGYLARWCIVGAAILACASGGLLYATVHAAPKASDGWKLRAEMNVGKDDANFILDHGMTITDCMDAANRRQNVNDNYEGTRIFVVYSCVR